MSDVKRTLAETADAADAMDRDIRQSLEETGRPTPDAATPVAETSEARWVAPEPPVGVSPGEAWKGLDDPMPGNVVPLEAPGPTPEDRPDEEAANPPAGEDGGSVEAPTAREDDEVPDRGE